LTSAPQRQPGRTSTAESQEHAAPDGAHAGQIVLHLRQSCAIRRGRIRTCADCGTRFRAPNSSQRRCRRCFRALKERDEAEARQDAYDAAWDSGYRSGRLSALNKELLRDLIQLCHPDRHSGRVDLATRVTRQLLELRERIRRAA
jgi:hypothetical protein